MMSLVEQKEKLLAEIANGSIDEWQVSELFEKLEEVDSDLREVLIAQVAAIWPVSHSLCLSFIDFGIQFAEIVPAELYPEWVRQILEVYEQDGLSGARSFMAAAEASFLQPLQGSQGVVLAEIKATLVHFLRGLSGRTFSIEAASVPWTDTGTIFLPERLQLYSDNKQNFALYKLLATLQYLHVESGIFSEIMNSGEIEGKFSSYADQRLGSDLFGVLQFARIYPALKLQFPGLHRQTRDFCLEMVGALRSGNDPGELVGFIAAQLNDIIIANNVEAERHDLEALFLRLESDYELYSRLGEEYRLRHVRFLLGAFDFKTASEVILVRRRENREQFITLLRLSLEKSSRIKQAHEHEQYNGGSTEVNVDDLVVFINKHTVENRASNHKSIKIDNEGFELSDELLLLAKEIGKDLGSVPKAYVQAAAGVGGVGGAHKEGDAGAEVEQHNISTDGYTAYDEWDYRRAGYRKNWCHVYEKTLKHVRSNFVESTVEKYRSQKDSLRRQFEMLRTQERFCRRRRHGNEIDFDALVEALGDSRAGQAPSDRLFVRLLRDSRDVSTLFLVDMSNSTEGWVGLAMKETLVLMAEVMEILGDPYGIYGFSGMRRSKSELYHIKHIQEPYNDMVQQRIGAITPRDYTRMGPPIRHLTKRLLESESKIKLLLIISDGKPEDYDGYVGEYAIEDTRKALLEARGAGVHPFCITIDKANHEYLPHMFGRDHYLFVKDVRALPAKMARMYRLLTA